MSHMDILLGTNLKAYVRDSHALDLIDKFLTIDPAKRIDSDTALNHDFFWTDPLPCELANMLKPLTRSMFQYLNTNERKAKRHCAEPSREHPTTNDAQYHDIVF